MMTIPMLHEPASSTVKQVETNEANKNLSDE